ncbi:hypothetical protein SAMN05192552_10524 [Natrinema hispanicum]|uniref:Uncharacterized protein n=1 Tax=Natrinema hispanicum TaxID=392421 RepID=A0A1G6XV99_9EURY|nr:hypothetical protein SAMN05192552_10524 [Natrinema hispanicum]
MQNADTMSGLVQLTDAVSVLPQPESHPPTWSQDGLVEQTPFDETRSRSPRGEVNDRTEAAPVSVALEALFETFHADRYTNEYQFTA